MVATPSISRDNPRLLQGFAYTASVCKTSLTNESAFPDLIGAAESLECAIEIARRGDADCRRDKRHMHEHTRKEFQ